jgi:hypothetical protein
MDRPFEYNKVQRKNNKEIFSRYAKVNIDSRDLYNKLWQNKYYMR